MLNKLVRCEKIISQKVVLAELRYSRSWLYEQIKIGKFPKPDRKVGRKNQWSRSVFDKYLKDSFKEKSENLLQSQSSLNVSVNVNSAISCSITFKY